MRRLAKVNHLENYRVILLYFIGRVAGGYLPKMGETEELKTLKFKGISLLLLAFLNPINL
jgi:hypothetical protein